MPSSRSPRGAVTTVLVVAALVGAALVTRSLLVLTHVRSDPRPFATTGQRSIVAPSTSSDVAAPRPTAARVAVREPFVPTGLQLKRLGIDAPVIELVSADHVLNPPEKPSLVGWWLASSLAGATSGSTVIVGHVDTARTGPGALFRLGQVHDDDVITLEGTSGTATYKVDSLTLYDKNDGLPNSVFTSIRSRLVLVTCGGPFDRATGSYRDNVVVTAHLVSAG